MNKKPKSMVGVADVVGKIPSVSECLELILRQSNGLIDAVLDGLAKAIDPAQKITKQVQYGPLAKAAIEELLDHRAHVQEVFAQHLRRGMYLGTGVGADSAPLVRFDQLQLLEDNQLDESIEIARAEQELSSSVEDNLPPVDALMSTVLGWITVQPQTNPVRPEVFVRALRESFLPYVKDTEVRGFLIAPAANILGVQLRKLYKDFANWLRARHVEPAGLNMSASPADKPERNAGLGNSVVRTLLTLDRLRRLLTGELDEESQDAVNKALGRNKDFVHTVPASVVALQDMQQVEALVQRLTERAKGGGDVTPQEQARKARLRALTDNKQMGEAIGQEVVRLMVENLVGDERLLPKVRKLLQSLEPVLMNLAKSNAQFFNDRQHPARLFVDKLIQRSLAYTTENDEEFYRFLRAAESAIAELIDAPQDNPPFVALIEKLEKTWAKEDASLRHRREEAARALLHAEQRYLLAQKLAEEFKEQVAGKDVPVSVLNFLCGPWAQSVAEAELTSAEGGASDPRGYRALVDDLVWSVQPSVAKRNRKRLVHIIPGMLTKLREGLSLVEFPPDLIADLFDQLIAIHEAALEGMRPSAGLGPDGKPAGRELTVTDSDWDVFGPSGIDAEGPDVWLGPNEAAGAGYLEQDSVFPVEMLGQEGEDLLPAVDSAKAAATPQAQAVTEPSPAPPAATGAPSATPAAASASSAATQPTAVQVNAPKALSTGSWIELNLEGEWTRLQLTWASPHRTLFMFTSRGGKAHSMSQRTMEKLRAQGLMRVISDGRVVEHALDAVAELALRNSAEQARQEPGNS
jgi:Protein of unknown function (DUF1631)